MDSDTRSWPPGPTVEGASDTGANGSVNDTANSTSNGPIDNTASLTNNTEANANSDSNAHKDATDAASATNVNTNDNTVSNPSGPENAPVGDHSGPATEAQSEEAAAAAAQPTLDRIQIVVKDQQNNQTGFQLKSNTKMSKVMNYYAERVGRQSSTLRFFFEGERILPDMTAGSLEMGDGDIIECMTEQLGGTPSAVTDFLDIEQAKSAPTGAEGSVSPAQRNATLEFFETMVDDFVQLTHETKPKKQLDDSNRITLRVRGGAVFEDKLFKMKPTSKMQMLKDGWIKTFQCKADVYLVLEVDGVTLDLDKTAEQLDLMDGDTIHVEPSDKHLTFGPRDKYPLFPSNDSDLDSDDETSSVSASHADNKPATVIFRYVRSCDTYPMPQDFHAKVYKTTPFQKALTAIAKRKKQNVELYRLSVDGLTIYPSDTMESAGLEDKAIIKLEDDPLIGVLDLTTE